MTRKKLVRLTALAATVAALALIACLGTASAKPAAVSGNITLLAGTVAKPAYDLLISNFKRVYPNVNVTPTYSPANTLQQLMITQLQTGAGPDVMEVNPGQGFQPSLIAFAKAGYLTDLSSSPWAKRVPRSVKPLVTVDGKVYGWVLGEQSGSILYNKALFAQYGLKPAQTFAQLLALCQAIRQKAPDKIPIAFGPANFIFGAGTSLTYGSNDVYAYESNWNAKKTNGQTSFAGDPRWHTAIQRIVDMKNANCFSPGVSADTPITNFAQFASGQAVMEHGFDSFQANVLAISPTMKIGVFLPPASVAKNTRLTAFASLTLVVNAKSSNQEAARAFVDFMARQKQNTLWAKVAHVVAPYDYQRAMNPKIGTRALDSDHKFLVPYLRKIVIAGSATFPSVATTLALGTGVQGIFSGSKSVDDVLKAADDSWGK